MTLNPNEREFRSKSHYGFHLAGPRGLFLKVAKTWFILLNGSIYAQCATPRYLKTVQFSSVNREP